MGARRPPGSTFGSIRRVVGLALCLVACRETDAHLYVSDVVWSDDGERVAYAVQRFDTSYPRRDPRDDRNENHSFEVWTSALDGSDRQLWRDGHGGAGSLYYMRQAGYLLLSHHHWVEEPGRSALELLRTPGEPSLVWDVGGHDDVCDGCELRSVLPSPTGSLLAVRYIRQAFLERNIHALEILDAHDGTSVWGPQVLDRDAGAGNWLTDDEYLVERPGGTSWRWRSDRDALEVLDRPHCSSSLVPATTSSPIDAEGRIVCATDEAEPALRACECQDEDLDVPLSWCYQAVPFGGCPRW